MQIWLKGTLSPEDVEESGAAGVDGVVISNHGGRQLDSVPATLDALRQCAPIARGRIQIAVDGGIRRGSVPCVGIADLREAEARRVRGDILGDAG